MWFQRSIYLIVATTPEVKPWCSAMVRKPVQWFDGTMLPFETIMFVLFVGGGITGAKLVENSLYRVLERHDN